MRLAAKNLAILISKFVTIFKCLTVQAPRATRPEEWSFLTERPAHFLVEVGKTMIDIVIRVIIKPLGH